MRIVKPYGRSHVEKDAAARTRRVLRLRANPEEPRDIEEFAGSHDELVIAQWISTIDKIATKPVGRKGPTEEQRALRERLGKAAWAILEAKGLLPGLRDAKRKEHLVKLWKGKVHPYGTTPYKAKRDRQGRDFPPPSPKGRWYDRFTGGVEVAEVDAAGVARKIHEHLHGAEYRIGADRPNRRHGLIAARARSIAVNVPQAGLSVHAERDWTAADREAYARAGNVAEEIRQAAQAREAGMDQARTRRVTPDIAGKALFGHYARLFKGDDGKALSIRDAREHAPGLFDLHRAVKDCYSRILKHHKKDQKAHGDRRRKVSGLLPDTMDRLFALVDAKGANRDLNALVRLGKVIHYQSSVGAEDSPDNVAKNWPADVSGSEFWTSDGQARIKRNEAFVRVWRHVLALASRTLTDWADPEGRENDILLDGPIRRAMEERFDANTYGRKLDLLYGSQAKFFKGEDAFQKGVLRLALEGAAGLRHGSFHFKGLGGFADALTKSVPAVDVKALAAVENLWQTDLRDRAEWLRKTMQGAHFDKFLDEAQNRRLFAALSGTGVGTIPLPRFNRVLHRAENAWSKENLRLPSPANRAALEQPARLCQYTALKLAYERPFRAWLETCDAKTLNGYIDRAVERATQAARDINVRNDEERRDLVVARAASLGRLADGEQVQDFFFNLSAETASEMRVQRGYDSDADSAREQAGYIEDLKCDVVALAFDAYLKEAGFDFLLGLAPDTAIPTAPLCDLDRMAMPDVDTSAADWKAVLYFLVHLVPVDEIGRLLHQTRKWELLAKDAEPTGGATIDRVRRIQSVLELYLDMHDAKFEGGAALAGAEAFKDLFASEDSFKRVFPPQPGTDDERRVPKRGLREIMRFGHRPALQPVFDAHRIAENQVAEFLAMEAVRDGKSGIARRQERRESLHETWAENKSLFGDDLRAYVEALSDVVRHRHLVAHVTLTDHVRLHRLLMAVLGRLVDYSGLWERDLYFVALALIHQSRCRPEDIFTDEGLKLIGSGRIVEALRDKNLKTAAAVSVLDGLKRHFGNDFRDGSNGKAKIRNDFAHFNMLKSNNLPVDLTACVNAARDLMAYDRKLRNAVSQSIKELLHREGLDLDWTMDADHRLGAATLATRQAQHLGKTRLLENRGPKPRKRPICENLHGHRYVEMAAALFGRAEARKQPSIVDLDLDAIDWNAAQGRDRNRNGPGKNRARHRSKGRPDGKNRGYRRQ